MYIDMYAYIHIYIYIHIHTYVHVSLTAYPLLQGLFICSEGTFTRFLFLSASGLGSDSFQILLV